MTLACEDTNSKLVDIDTVANVDDEDCIGNSLLQIWELRIVHKAKLLFRLQHKVWSKMGQNFHIWLWSGSRGLTPATPFGRLDSPYFRF